eukprot:CAMPEP_0174343620 /NCGR_PEP_ID=MMETSP0810-20121108/27099_1 /TAXON_ID=73025 ORGANISM="Eutreptiella gymnastica-like, Strain CCMP1594" /NCGR_SAMPLE_ID=MMETSP0810 /ASSEMBLY_ACC=CAM_ASM_000659 /LENGTH=42 /DNA_ID= /DNA_START= /DNA_END= /DNA_ORIENTATION=
MGLSVLKQGQEAGRKRRKVQGRKEEKVWVERGLGRGGERKYE